MIFLAIDQIICVIVIPLKAFMPMIKHKFYHAAQSSKFKSSQVDQTSKQVQVASPPPSGLKPIAMTNCSRRFAG
eukprot:13486210-Heterocapsa_arctica.AAC.1